MFRHLFKSRKYHWRPAIDLRDRRIAEALSTFPYN